MVSEFLFNLKEIDLFNKTSSIHCSAREGRKYCDGQVVRTPQIAKTMLGLVSKDWWPHKVLDKT